MNVERDPIAAFEDDVLDVLWKEGNPAYAAAGGFFTWATDRIEALIVERDEAVKRAGELHCYVSHYASKCAELEAERDAALAGSALLTDVRTALMRECGALRAELADTEHENSEAEEELQKAYRQIDALRAEIESHVECAIANEREACAAILDSARGAAGRNDDLRAYELLGGLAAAIRARGGAK